jgi:hypothetical protein
LSVTAKCCWRGIAALLLQLAEDQTHHTSEVNPGMLKAGNGIWELINRSIFNKQLHC